MSTEPKRTSFLSRVKAHPTRKAALWLLTVVGSALIGLLIKTWWDAPRPHIELSTVQLRSSGDPGMHITVPLEVRERIKLHDYINDLGEALTVKDLTDAKSSAEAGDVVYKSLIERVDKLLELVQSRPATLDINERRREFLHVWFADTQGETLATITKIIIGGRIETLPQNYRSPRSGDYIRMVELRPGFTINLTEIDGEEQARSESSVLGAVNIYQEVLRDAEHSNILRRMFDFMEPVVIIPILKEVRKNIEKHLQESKEIVDQLNATLRSAQPERLVATIIITNRGGRPLALRNLGVLWLKLPPQNGGNEELLAVHLNDDTTETVTVVDAGNVKALTLSSSKTAAQLVEQHKLLQGTGDSSAVTVTSLESSRLNLLFQSGGIAAAVALARAGSKPTDALIGMTDFRPVGASGDNMILEALKSSTKP